MFLFHKDYVPNTLQTNGVYERLGKIDQNVDEMKIDFVIAVKDLTTAINGLSLKIEAVKDSIPIKVVAWMFGILVIALIGVQGTQWLFHEYLKTQ